MQGPKNRQPLLPPDSRQARSSALAQNLLKRRQGAAADEIPVRPAGAPVPLSFAQERLWFLDRLTPGTSAYNIARAFVFEGPLHVAALVRSLKAVVARHESLRATFSAEEGLSQAIASPDQASPLPPLPVVDLSGLPVSEAEMARLEREEARRPFDLERGPLLRSTLLRLGAREHELLLSIHHIAADGWSLGIFLRELGELFGRVSCPRCRSSTATSRSGSATACRGSGCGSWSISGASSSRGLPPGWSCRPTAPARRCRRSRARAARGRWRPRSRRGCGASAPARRSRRSWLCSPPSRGCCRATPDRRICWWARRWRGARGPSWRG